MQIDNAEIYTYKVPEPPMKLTEEQIKENLACYEQAMRTGTIKGIEYLYSPEWRDKGSFDFSSRELYRRKLQPKLIPYDAQTWPLDADWVRHKGGNRLPTRVSDLRPRGPVLGIHNSAEFFTWEWLYLNHELTRDHGKTWEPCGRPA